MAPSSRFCGVHDNETVMPVIQEALIPIMGYLSAEVKTVALKTVIITFVIFELIQRMCKRRSRLAYWNFYTMQGEILTLPCTLETDTYAQDR